MKPKLIILNGPLGVGKSTLAARYAEEHPLSLNLDIDIVWSMLGNWREEKESSAPLAKSIGLSMAKVVLEQGHDVIVPQILQTTELADSFALLARNLQADYYEILLHTEKKNAIARFIERGQNQGYETGFRPGGIIDTNGREAMLSEMYDTMMAVADQRPQTIRIASLEGDITATYHSILKQIT